MAWRKRSKFGNHKVVLDGIKFDSKKEAARYQVLKVWLAAGQISDLEWQVKYKLEVAGKKICTYIPDFRYFDKKLKCVVCEDVKGVETAVFRLKAKLFRALYPDIVFEVVK